MIMRISTSFKRPGRLALGVVVATAALTLAACGGHSNNNTGGAVPPAADNPNPPVVADSFITIVKALITVTNETAEPGPIGDVTATAPETTAPDPTP